MMSNGDSERMTGRARRRSSLIPHPSSLAALALMLLGAWIMAYPYLYAVGGSFKTRAEFTNARSALIPPRFQPAKLVDRYVLDHADAEYDRARKQWPIQRNYVEAIIYGGID